MSQRSRLKQKSEHEDDDEVKNEEDDTNNSLVTTLVLPVCNKDDTLPLAGSSSSGVGDYDAVASATNILAGGDGDTSVDNT